MPPQRANLVLPTDIPDIEFDVLVCDVLDVEPDCRNSSHVLVELQFVQDRYSFRQKPLTRGTGGKHTGLARRIQSQHEQSHLLRSEDLAHNLRN